MTRSTVTAAFIAAIPLLLFPFMLHAGSAQPPQQTRGEQLFAQNCSRCHMPPMSISPRATGTVLMHMRTRARLSREDEQALLHFMAPK
jgi:mono/diheme cytochrome c family protein